MKKQSNSFKFSLMILAAFIILCGWMGCQSKQEDKTKQNEEKAENGGIGSFSIYNLDSEWQTQDGEKIKLASLQGKIRVVAMVFTSCEYACPRMVEDIQAIENSIDSLGRKDVGFVLVTFDSETDTPEVLRQFAVQKNLDLKNWTLLHGSDDNVAELAAVLGVKYKKFEKGSFSHANIINIIHPNGDIVKQQEGLGVPPDSCAATINRLLKM